MSQREQKEPFITADQVIPEMTHELSKHWDQPQRRQILLSGQHAIMSKRVFDALPEYSTSIPSGVYEGKMWKRQEMTEAKGSYGLIMKPTGKWWLCWFGEGKAPDKCSINFRKIVLDV